jgi:hypothetical protein
MVQYGCQSSRPCVQVSGRSGKRRQKKKPGNILFLFLSGSSIKHFHLDPVGQSTTMLKEARKVAPLNKIKVQFHLLTSTDC